MKNEIASLALGTALEAKALSLALKDLIMELHPEQKERLSVLLTVHMGNLVENILSEQNMKPSEELQEALDKLRS